MDRLSRKQRKKRERASPAALHAAAWRIAGAVDRVLPAIASLFIRRPHGNDLMLVGSGVLLRVGPSEFLVTAAHVRDLARGQLYVGGETSVHAIAGEYSVTTAPNGDRERDPFDLAILPLNDRHMAGFRDCRFLGVDDLDAFDEPDHRPVVGSHYLLTGYPASQQERTVDGETRINPLRFAARAVPPAHQAALGWAADTHIVIEYDKKRAWNTKGIITPPAVYGVSGGGLFRLYGRLPGEPTAERLVGIPIRYAGTSGKAVIATRVGVLADGMARRYPHVRRYLQPLLVRPRR